MVSAGTKSKHGERRRYRHAFSLMEAAVGTAIAAILLTCYSTLSSMAYSTQRRAVQQYQALVVLDNVVECLATQDRVDLASVQRTVEHEFGQSMFSHGSTVTWRCRQEGDIAQVVLLDTRKAALAQAEVSLK